MTPPITLERLRKRAQFLRARQGFRASRPTVSIEAIARNAGAAIGVGFTASRKVGNAVVRNRARRRLKEAARQLLPMLGVPGADYVLVARQSTAEATWVALLDDVRNALIRLRAELESGRSPKPSGASKQRPKHPTESD
jgi:ribonuclease P protein component